MVGVGDDRQRLGLGRLGGGADLWLLHSDDRMVQRKLDGSSTRRCWEYAGHILMGLQRWCICRGLRLKVTTMKRGVVATGDGRGGTERWTGGRSLVFVGGWNWLLNAVEGADSRERGVEIKWVLGCCGKCCCRKVRQVATVGHDKCQFSGWQAGRNKLDATHVDTSSVVVEILSGNRLQRLRRSKGVCLVRTWRPVGKRGRCHLLKSADAIAEMADQSLLDTCLHAINLIDVTADLIRAVCEAGFKFVQNGCVAVDGLIVGLRPLYSL